MTQSFIADNIGVNKSTISRELARNTGKRSYRYKQAQMFARYRQSVPKYQKWNNDIQRQVNRKLCLQWSPEQISGWLKIKQNISISHERIYQYILQDKKSGGSLWTHLRHANKKRKKRYGKADRRGIIPNKVMIVERPSVVDEKTRIGDFELRPFKFQVQLFTPKKEQDAVGIIYSFLGLVKRSTNEPIQTSYSRAKIPYLSMFKTGNDAVIHC